MTLHRPPPAARWAGRLTTTEADAARFRDKGSRPAPGMAKNSYIKESGPVNGHTQCGSCLHSAPTAPSKYKATGQPLRLTGGLPSALAACPALPPTVRGVPSVGGLLLPHTEKYLAGQAVIVPPLMQ